MCALLSEVWCCCVYDIEKTHNAHNCAVTIIALRCKMFEKVFCAPHILRARSTANSTKSGVGFNSPKKARKGNRFLKPLNVYNIRTYLRTTTTRPIITTMQQHKAINLYFLVLFWASTACSNSSSAFSAYANVVCTWFSILSKLSC